MQITYRDGITKDRWLGETVEGSEVLCVSKRDGFWQVYDVRTGRPFIKVKFVRREDALAFGKRLHGWYGEMLWIGDDPQWKGINIPQLVQYTIPNGEEIHQMIQSMEKREFIQELDYMEGVA